MARLALYFPFLYFTYTRFNNKKAWLFHSYFEWIPALVILYSSSYQIYEALVTFVWAYGAFISIYEIGYFINDFYSINNEEKPRKRGEGIQTNNFLTSVFIIIRLVTFGVISYYLKFYSDPIWIGFYGTLCIVIIMHNFITEKQLKPVTFFSMALMRFFAPVFMFVDHENLEVFVISVVVNYVFFRLLSYMDSKQLLKMDLRQTPIFKVYFYLILLPLNLLLTFLFSSIWPISFGCYYLLFTFLNLMLSRRRIKSNGLQ